MTTLEQCDAELEQLHADVRKLQSAPSAFAEVWPAIEAGLDQAQATFTRLGPLIGVVPRLPEHVHERHLAMVGMALAANRKAIVDSERARIRAATEGGIGTADKARRLDEIRAAILRTAAKRELALRKVEGEGEFRPRPTHPELLIFPQAEVERLAR
jgi:hypothetical protein